MNEHSTSVQQLLDALKEPFKEEVVKWHLGELKINSAAQKRQEAELIWQLTRRRESFSDSPDAHNHDRYIELEQSCERDQQSLTQRIARRNTSLDNLLRHICETGKLPPTKK